jgi:protoporphyrinogen/coproporphyrinogen III oxidase
MALPKNAPAALNRYVYYPNRLVRMPHPGLGLVKGVAWPVLTSSLFSGLFSGLAHEYRTSARPANIEDETIADWFTRRLGSPKLAENLASALLHGIYAGSVHQLSMKSIFPGLWEMDAGGSLLNAIWKTTKKEKTPLPPASFRGREAAFKQKMIAQLPDPLVQLAKDTSVYSFKGAISTLSDALEKTLRANPNVDIQLGTKIKSLAYDAANDGITV